MKIPCGKNALDQETEDLLWSYLVTLSEWGFPVTAQELRFLVSNYIQRVGWTIKKFSDGVTPGVEWTKSFISRHADKLSAKMVQNINPSWIRVDQTFINSYFDHQKTYDVT